MTFLIAALAVAAAMQKTAAPPAGDWPAYNRTLAGDRFSPLKEINAGNVKNLVESCAVDLPNGRSFQSGPLAIDGTLFVTTDVSTYAIDGATCAIRWTHAHPYPQKPWGGANRGAAYLDGRLFRGSGDGHVFAIDARSGASLWDTPIGDPERGETVPMAPLAWRGIVFAGNAGGDIFGVTGRVYALDAESGAIRWVFQAVPETPEVLATWPMRSKNTPPTGGAFWTTFSLDENSGILYVSSGNPAPDYVIELRDGTNLYTNCIIALDARSGKLLGYVQTVKRDFHDWDVSAAPALVTTRGGTHLALAAGKDGYLHGINLPSIDLKGGAGSRRGGIRYSSATTTHLNTTARFSTTKYTRFCPGVDGGSVWNGPAYDAGHNLALVPAVDWCSSIKMMPLDELKGTAGHAWTGGDKDDIFGRADPVESRSGWLTAFDADSGKAAWKYHATAPLIAGVTPTAGGIVFTADLNGSALAFDTVSGKLLWQRATGEPAGAGVIAYQAGGQERIAVAAGLDSPIWLTKAKRARIVVFSLLESVP